MLAVAAGGRSLDIYFFRLSFFVSFSLSLGDGPIWTEILSQKTASLKLSTNLYLNIKVRFFSLRYLTETETIDMFCSVIQAPWL